MQLQVYEDRWYQTEAVDALFDFFNSDACGTDLTTGLPKKANPLVCLPTGTGKSVVIARFIQRALAAHPGTRVFMSTHVKDLIAQNARKMLQIWPHAPLGIYSAGLKSRDSMQPIVFGGIQSSVKKFPLFGRRDLLVVDEAHLIGSEGNYIKFINELTYGPEGCDKNSPNINPYLKVIGLSATAYRLGMGMLTNGNIFTHIVYDICNMDGFARLLEDGYICRLISKPMAEQLDTSEVSISNGDFVPGQLEAAVDKEPITYRALSETVEAGYDRRSWLIFASGTTHADNIAEMLNTVFGVSCVAIHSKKTAKENGDNLLAWQQGKVRAAVSMNSLTTGIDHPACDMIVVLRPTVSPGLWVQMLGRGTRPYDSSKCDDPIAAAAFPGIKLNCLVLDFARNTKNLGPINDPMIPKKKGEGAPGDAPVRTCPADKQDETGRFGCGCYNHSSARECIVCGFIFPIRENIEGTYSTEEVMISNLPQYEWFAVKRTLYKAHISKQGNPSIQVSYFCGMRTFFEYLNFEAESGFIKHIAHNWFRQRYHYDYKPAHWGEADYPPTNAEVLSITNELREPARIRIWVNRKNPKVEEHEF